MTSKRFCDGCGQELTHWSGYWECTHDGDFHNIGDDHNPRDLCNTCFVAALRLLKETAVRP